MSLIRIGLCLLFCISLVHAADQQAAHDAFMQNRPDEAIPILFKQAESEQRWFDYYDLGLAAHHSGQHGKAVAWLLEAHQRAPEMAEPLQALQALKVQMPASWLERLGPLAIPGIGYNGLIFMLLAGFAAALALLHKRWRWRSIVLMALCLVVSLPGSIAHSIDSQRSLIATVTECPLLGPTGQPLQTLKPGTILVAEKRMPNNRILVRLPNDQRGFIDSQNCHATP